MTDAASPVQVDPGTPTPAEPLEVERLELYVENYGAFTQASLRHIAPDGLITLVAASQINGAPLFEDMAKAYAASVQLELQRFPAA